MDTGQLPDRLAFVRDRRRNGLLLLRRSNSTANHVTDRYFVAIQNTDCSNLRTPSNESKRPRETNLRLEYESARGVVTRVAEIGRAKPVDNIARPDCEMPGAAQIKTRTASHCELAVES